MLGYATDKHRHRFLQLRKSSATLTTMDLNGGATVVKHTTAEAAAVIGVPPAEPPADCPHPAVWRLAHTLYQIHDRGELCDECGEVAPCSGRDLAEQGLATALGRHVAMSGYWHALTGLRLRTMSTAS
jgi:hypothetical protein